MSAVTGVRSASASALAGVLAAQSLALEAADRIARGDLDALPDAFIDLVRAKHAHAASLVALRVQGEMDRSALDILA